MVIFFVTKSHGYFVGETPEENGLLMENERRNANHSESGS